MVEVACPAAGFRVPYGVDQMRPSDINKMGPLLVGGQPRADALGHDQHDRSLADVDQ